MTPGELARALAKIEMIPFTTCWIWVGATSQGYGQMVLEGSPPKYARVPRIMYEHFVGPIPPGYTIDHLCRQTLCVRPEHLEPVTRRENTLRGDAPTAKNARKTHCNHGHEFTTENTYWSPLGRHCRTCRASAEARRQARRLAAAG